jgi:hypothetical protein
LFGSTVSFCAGFINANTGRCLLPMTSDIFKFTACSLLPDDLGHSVDS